MKAKAEQAASLKFPSRENESTVKYSHDTAKRIGFVAGAEWQASEMAEQLAAKDAVFNKLLEYIGIVIEEEFGAGAWDRMSEEEKEEARHNILIKTGINR